MNKGAGIRVYDASAIPNWNELVLNGGTYNIQIESGDIQLGDIELRDDAELVSPIDVNLSTGTISAESAPSVPTWITSTLSSKHRPAYSRSVMHTTTITMMKPTTTRCVTSTSRKALLS